MNKITEVTIIRNEYAKEGAPAMYIAYYNANRYFGRTKQEVADQLSKYNVRIYF